MTLRGLEKVSPIIKFHPYQMRWLKDRSRFKLGRFARQTGKTFTTSGEIVENCVDAAVAQKRTRWVILSRGERQAKEAMDEAIKPMTKAFWEVYRGVLRGEPPKPYQDEWRSEETGEKYKTFEVEFPGGSRITAIPANPDTARGFSSNAFLDEFAFHKDSKAIWGALFPVVSKGKQVLRVTSTPNGKSNKFYELATGRDAVWSRHTVDIYQAVADGLDRNIEELRAGLKDPDLWAQEYELQWLDEATAWLDFDLINACETPGYGQIKVIEYAEGQVTKAAEHGTPPAVTNYAYYVGMDIARRKDLTCIWVAVKIGDVLYPVEIITMRRAPFGAQHAEMDRVVKRYNPVRVSIDQTGMGEPFVEEQQRRNGKYRVEGVLFTIDTKFALASTLKERMEDRKFRIPEGEMDIREDLHSITKAVTNTGSVRLVHDGESDGHGDRFWAAALVCNAANDNGTEYAYTPVDGERQRAGSILLPNDDDYDLVARGGRGRGTW